MKFYLHENPHPLLVFTVLAVAIAVCEVVLVAVSYALFA